jgi:succinoglycan biosynthesis protein ExoO
LVSVLVPAYNAASSIESAIQSALSQTMPDLEIVVVDDGSTDDTRSVVEDLARNDPRVRVIVHEENRGTSRAVNLAIDSARGAWVSQLDADDRWLPQRLERLLAFEANADVVADDIHVVGDDAEGNRRNGFESGSMLRHIGLTISVPRRLGLLEFLKRDPGLVHPLVRRSFLQDHGLKLQEANDRGADFALWSLLLAHGARWVQLPEAYYVYTRAPQAVSRDLRQVVEAAVNISRYLAAHPLIAAHPGARRALKRRERLFHAHLVHAQARDLLAQGRFISLFRLLALQPRNLFMLLWRKSWYMRIRSRQRGKAARRRYDN